MSSEALLSTIIPFAGSGLGYAMGFVLKKVLKWMLIIIGFLVGIFFVGVQLLQKYGYVSTVNWDKFGNDTSTEIQHWTANIDVRGYYTSGASVLKSQERGSLTLHQTKKRSSSKKGQGNNL
jgi:uncharacterized membrane protein (Fun14 family)